MWKQEAEEICDSDGKRRFGGDIISAMRLGARRRELASLKHTVHFKIVVTPLFIFFFLNTELMLSLYKYIPTVTRARRENE